ncbi:hypothetical protein FOPG_07864 [Fusarium oxysporum f. sp. conglutinans race 2 54008]|uniref:Uncharacterized protein n=1 Tax=Fusarium oxysporum f. sp. conglutinans race 2 54008 TaxID=1089457 RepID=X0I195_FUSOX|nr:hypothetical protein FOPG_07864 [Fusarium oxysporum f. sp. conglutinans race 2 54008]KAI8414937.1 hypothetical protein FOFC_04556 [Fusarium oxysporum]
MRGSFFSKVIESQGVASLSPSGLLTFNRYNPAKTDHADDRLFCANQLPPSSMPRTQDVRSLSTVHLQPFRLVPSAIRSGIRSTYTIDPPVCYSNDGSGAPRRMKTRIQPVIDKGDPPLYSTCYGNNTKLS